MADFPSVASIKSLNACHEEFRIRQGYYQEFVGLFEGGIAVKDSVNKFLRKRPKELSDVYIVRQANFSYSSLLGNIIGWYTAAIFKHAPQILKTVADLPPETASDIPAAVKDFCELFEGDADGAGGMFVNFWPQVLESLLLFQSGYVLVDLPMRIPGPEVPSRMAQEKGGLLDPYLVFYDPQQVINWQEDARGNLEWVTIYIRASEQIFLQGEKLVDYWYYFDREQCALYERDVPVGENSFPDAATATLAEGYPRPHAMSDLKRVPIRKIRCPKGLWLANRVYLPLLNHLNLDNSLDFGLFQANLAQLVIEDGTNGTYEEGNVPGGAPTASEVGYHHLPNGGDMRYLEPEGHSFQISQERLDNLEERIYKACYLTDQARTNKSTPTAQSGISKAMDKTPSRDAMSGLGELIRAGMQGTYEDVLLIRGFADIDVDIRGLDFGDKVSADDLDLLEKGTIIEVNSPTYEREIAKKVVRLSLPDINPAQLAAIDGEIDKSPTPNEMAKAQEEQQRADMLNKFTQSFKGAGAIQ